LTSGPPEPHFRPKHILNPPINTLILLPATSLHLVEAEGYEIHPKFISLVRELNFAGGLDENPYRHLQDVEEKCAILMISGMNHETLKWKTFPFSLTRWAKQWYKLHVSSYHGKGRREFGSSLVQIQSTCFVRSRVSYVYAAFCAQVGYKIH
jgi:hypothetical protein